MSVDVIIVQHAEKRREAGDPGLTATGRRQAVHVAAHLAERRPTPAALWSSPLKRAVETATAIAEQLHLPLQIDRRLRERMNWTGDGQSLTAFLAEWERASADRDFAPTMGDSSRSAGDRFLVAIDELARRHADEVVVVVAHGGVTFDLLRTLGGDHAVRALLADGMPSCALTRLRNAHGVWEVVEVASTDHLVPAPPPRG
ncbi:MAG: histidine phosphatase family protein [Acidimicrobiales bacterium]